MELRDYQKDCITKVINKSKQGVSKQVIVLATGLGKAQPVTNKIVTDVGYAYMGDLREGDFVFGRDGFPTQITGIFPQGNKEVYGITFDDGTYTEACGEHLWAVQTRFDKNKKRGFKIKSTFDLLGDTLLKNGGKKWFVPVNDPVEFSKKDFKISPYLLGALLGDGGIKYGIIFSSIDREILERVSKEAAVYKYFLKHLGGCDYRFHSKRQHGSLIKDLKTFGLFGKGSYDKFIPEIYLRGSIEQRLDLLRGLMDTDGSIRTKDGHCEFSSTSIRLVKDLCELVRSLGGTPQIKPKKTSSKFGISFRVRVSIPYNPFYVLRKAKLWKEVVKYGRTKAIIEIKGIGKKDSVCIKVDNEDALYLTNDFIVTHNTVVFSHFPPLVRNKGKKTLILAHREELLEQAKNKLLAVDATLKVGIEQAEKMALDTDDVVIASVPTLGREGSKRIERFDPENFGMVIIDECFVAGTKIDGRNIENIKVGDVVNSYNEKTGELELKKVVRLFKNPVRKLVKVTLSDARIIICTPEHPFYIEGEWVEAIKLKSNSLLTDITEFVKVMPYAKKDLHKTKGVCGMQNNFSTEVLEQYHDSDVFDGVQKNNKGEEKEKNSIALLPMQKNCNCSGKSASAICQSRESLLLGKMQKGISKDSKFRNDAKNEPEILLRKDEEEQSNAESRVYKKDGGENERENFFKQRREWEDDKTTIGLMESFRSALNQFRVSYKNKGGKGIVREFASLLFSRHRNRGSEIGYRSGRSKSSIEEMEIFRSKKNICIKSVRVESVEILEPRSGRGFEEVCSDGFVYNFEVEDNNNYFANGILVHNCHHATSKSYRNILDYFGVLKGSKNQKGGKLLLGVTATPNRSDHAGLDSIFDEITFNYTLRKGIENGYLSDISAYSINTQTDISKVSTRMGDFADKELAEVIDNDTRNKLIVDSYLEIAPDSKALCFAIDVEHAHNLLDYFTSAGISSACVIGATDKDVRTQVLQDFKEGKVKVLINVGVFTEGFDEPSIETILMARPTKSSVLFAQMIGRGTRLHPGKKSLTLIDFADNTGKNQVVGLPSLFGLPNLKGGKKGKKIMEMVAKAEKILEVNPEHDLTQIEDWSDDNIEKIIKRVDIFQQAQLPVAVKQHSQLSWELYFSGFRLQFPIGQFQDGVKYKEQLVIEENMLGHKTVRYEVANEAVPSYKNNYKKWVKTSEQDLAECEDDEAAFKWADNWVNENKPEFVKMFSQDSKWRKEVPSEKQIKMLQKFNIPIPPGLTRGQASILISKAINERNKKF